MRRTNLLAAITVFVLSPSWPGGPWTAFALGQQLPASYEPRVVLRQPLPAITDAPIVPAAESDLASNELVIGIEIDGQSRAYPINQLTGPRREIINDRLGDIAIAATW